MVVPVITKIIEWKELWQLVSGMHYETPKSTVLSELQSIKTELLNGVKNTKNTDDSNVKLEKCPEKLLPFIEKLQQCLDVDKQRTWDIFCCYLENEYNGSIQTLINFLSTETNTLKLLSNIWDYYSLERMIRLKIIKNILEFSNSKDHPFHSEYSKVLNEIGIPKLLESYIEQLRQLVKEVAPGKVSFGEYFNTQNRLVSWTERRLQETVEVLQILFLCVDHANISAKDFKTLVDLFKFHSFGRQQQYLDVTENLAHKDLIVKITYSEIGLFFKCIDLNTSYEANASWIKEVIAGLESDIVLLHQNPEHGPILLIWMLLNFRIIELNEDDPKFRKYRQFGSKAVALGVYEFLRTMLSHPLYRDQSLTSSLTARSIYNQLSFLCDLFDSDGAIAQHKGIYELLSELLKIPIVAKEFCFNEESGARSLLNTAMENFPFDFVPLSTVAHALSITGPTFHKFIRQKLENLTIYAERYNANQLRLRAMEYNDDQVVVANNYSPFGSKIDYIIKAGTLAVIMENRSEPTIHFKTSLNYFNALHNEINELMTDSLRNPELDAQRKRRICSGLRFLAAAVRRIRDQNEITSEMVHPTEMVFDILLKFKDIPLPPIELLAQCMEVCAALVPLFEKEIYNRVINLNILPFISNDLLSFREYSNGVSFDTGAVGYYLVSFERSVGKFDLLLAYLTFLRTFSKSASDYTVSLELPGLVFLLREVFPYVHTWRFEHETDRHKITTLVLQYFFDVLQLTDESGGNRSRAILRDTCVFNLLNSEGGMTLLKIVALGNSFIEDKMQCESNWMAAAHTSYNLLVQLSMTILMQILRLRSKVIDKSAGLSPLETIIYTQPKHVIPVVTGYMRNIFNRRLPILSCRLLRRFAIEFQMSLLACLDMEPAQIRSTFLERLENELESDQLKIAIMEFVEACINKQPGLTEAFFKIKYNEGEQVDSEKDKDSSEGILTYMSVYLKAVAENPNAVIESPLLSQIMSLFHSLWKNNMQSLVKKLSAEKDFWSSILNPLFGDVKANMHVHSQLFNIMGLELYRIIDPTDINVNFKQTLERFLKQDIFSDWVDSILAIPVVIDKESLITDDVPNWLNRLQSLKDLFVIILRRKKRHGIEAPSNSMEYFADQCLTRLVRRAELTEDFRPFIILSELYLTILLSFSYKYKTNEEAVATLWQINTILSTLSNSYAEIHVRAKESILGIVFKAIVLFSDELKSNAELTLNLLESTIKIISSELTETETLMRSKPVQGTTPTANEKKQLPFVLSLNILKEILISFSNESISSSIENHLLVHRIFHRVLSCLNVSLPLYYARKLSCEMLDLLIVIARGPISLQLLHCDISDYLWMKLLPPKELLQNPGPIGAQAVKVKRSQSNPTWQAHDWWPIYSRGIQLVTSLTEQHGHLIVKEAVIFVGVHEEFLTDSIMLSKHVLNTSAINLIRSTLELVCQLVEYESVWRLEHQQSMINLMRCVQVMLDHAVSLLYRPKILKRLIHDTPSAAATLHDASNLDESDTFEDEVRTMNELIIIVTICSNCLMRFSPSLMNLLTDREFLPSKWQPLIEIQFNAPKLNIGTSLPQLTFGTVLGAAVIFTKSLNLQQFTFDETALNDFDGADKTTTALSEKTITRKRNYTSSISVLSTTSATTPNELLASLDGHLCLSALELVLTLLASQSLLALKDINLSQREKQLIKRELCTELSVFFDFVKKRILAETREPLHRKKHGVQAMQPCNIIIPKSASVTESKSTRESDSMRVSVVRKLHLNTQQTPNQPKSIAFNMTHQISPIGETSPKSRTSSTPTVAMPLKSCLKSSTSKPVSKRIFESPYDQQEDDSSNISPGKKIYKIPKAGESITTDDEEEEQIFFEPEEPVYCETSFVRLVEEDYLHFLSNLFTYICQID